MKAKTNLLLYSALVVAITTLAYLRLIPTKLNSIPYFDSAGHFVLFGFWGWFFAKAYPKNAFRITDFRIFSGTLIAIFIALTEELLQSLSSVRSCDPYDFIFGSLGILTACIVLNYKFDSTQ